MYITKYYCDLCGEEIKYPKTNQVKRSGRIMVGSSAGHSVDIEVCGVCMQKFWELREKLHTSKHPVKG